MKTFRVNLPLACSWTHCAPRTEFRGVVGIGDTEDQARRDAERLVDLARVTYDEVKVIGEDDFADLPESAKNAVRNDWASYL